MKKHLEPEEIKFQRILDMVVQEILDSPEIRGELEWLLRAKWDKDRKAFFQIYDYIVEEMEKEDE